MQPTGKEARATNSNPRNPMSTTTLESPEVNTNHQVATREEWLAARKELLEAEKAHTRAHDELARKRRELPWVKVEKDYVFETADGSRTLADLFDGRSQLYVYHFMLPPGADQPCSGCSFIADHVDAARQHFEHADLSFAAVSRATMEEIERIKARFGWTFPWVSANKSDFNYDFGASFTAEQIAAGEASYNYEPYDDEEWLDLHGSSVFAKDESGQIHHTYSCYARGDERMLGAFAFLDLVPKGRNESSAMDWVRRHDEYEDDGRSSSCGACSSSREEVKA